MRKQETNLNLKMRNKICSQNTFKSESFQKFSSNSFKMYVLKTCNSSRIQLGKARSDRPSWPPLFRIDTAGLKSTQTCRPKTSHTQPSEIKSISNIIHKIFNVNRIKNWRTRKYSSESEDHFYIKN